MVMNCAKHWMDNTETKIASEMIALKLEPLAGDEQWLRQVLASLLTGERAGSQKVLSILNEFQANLSEDEINAFLSGIMDLLLSPLGLRIICWEWLQEWIRTSLL